MQGIKDLTEIERLNFLKTIQLGCSSHNEFESYVDEYKGNLKKEEVLRRIKGLFLEDEFLLLSKTMGSCSLINSVDQSIAINHNLKVPDFLASFNLDDSYYDKRLINLKFNSFIEAKSSNFDKTSKISKSFINKYSDFSEQYNLPLIFASRLNLNNLPMWIMQTDKQLIASGRSSSPTSMFDSIGHLIFNDFFIQSLQDIYIDCIYNSTITELNVYSEKFGFLESVTITIGSEKFELDKHSIPLYSFINNFTGYRSLGANKVFDKIIDRAIIPKLSMGLLSSMIIRSNYSLLSMDGEKYTSAAKFLSMVNSGKTRYIDRDLFLQGLTFFNNIVPTFITLSIGKCNKENIDILLSLKNT